MKQAFMEGPWKVTGLCDSDYAGDNDTRKSVTGYIIFLNGIILCWKSKGQDIVSLSSTEAEYIAVTNMTSELMFVRQVMKFLDMKMNEPMEINLDNLGALFLAENEYACQRTKHIDVRYHFIRQHVENESVKLKLIKSEDNISDIFTKNLGHKLFWKHAYELMEWAKDNEEQSSKEN